MDLLYNLVVGLIFSAIGSAARSTDKRKAALASVMLGIIAVLLTVLLALVVSDLVMPLFTVKPLGGGCASLGVLICLLLIPVAMGWPAIECSTDGQLPCAA